MNIPLVATIPFAGWLLTIALLPLLAPHFWDKNSNKALLGTAFSLPVLWFCISSNLQTELHHAILEFFSFIILLGSLFVISGGIFIKGDIQGTPRNNTLFLMIGALLSNIIGTTGGSMVLIRPFLRINADRMHIAHLPVFFIFLVSNIGGCLSPLADPPLFLGYLRGVPFFWNLQVFPIWLFVVSVLLGTFYVFDSRAYAKEAPIDLQHDREHQRPWAMEGSLNCIFLLGVVAAVFLPAPLREIVMVLMAVLARKVTSKKVFEKNQFTFHPIVEVAVVFAAVFITMIPAMALLKARGGELGITQPWQFFWATGLLSSFLDNAPTYLAFFSLAEGLVQVKPLLVPNVAGVAPALLQAISVGAVFMGANTYIGNGPNFMVRTLAENAGYPMPSFFGYMKYSLGILFPIFLVATFLFFR